VAYDRRRELISEIIRCGAHVRPINMEVSLEQAIEIHARVFKAKHKHNAPHAAIEHAARLKRVNDHEGHSVWIRVGDVAARLLADESKGEKEAGPNL
jgi:hypothetical protein